MYISNTKWIWQATFIRILCVYTFNNKKIEIQRKEKKDTKLGEIQGGMGWILDKLWEKYIFGDS